MSKAVTNEEVEDVLSSIRRLVSEDKRPLAGLRSAPVEPAATITPEPVAADEIVFNDLKAAQPKPAEISDRLVLTPALRVADVPAEAGGEPEQSSPLDLGAVARQTWEEDPPEVAQEAPLMLFPQEPDRSEARAQGEDPAMDALDALVHETLESEADAEAEAEENYSDESYWDDTPSTGSPADFDIEAQEQMRADEEAAFTDDDTLEEPSADVLEEPETPNFVPASELYGETGNISVLPLTAKIAALEAAVGGIKQEWEPDGNEEEDLVPADATAMAWEDDVDLDARGAPVSDDIEAIEQPAEPTQPDTAQEATPSGGTLGGDDQLLDEEALRELVSEIVREELQGALGERITRNVRKLVRREIHRALTAQELE